MSLQINAYDPHQMEFRTGANNAQIFEIDRYEDGTIELYIDDDSGDWDNLREGVGTLRLLPEDAPDFIVALQAWIETIK